MGLPVTHFKKFVVRDLEMFHDVGDDVTLAPVSAALMGR
jgi:hypothetical protein